MSKSRDPNWRKIVTATFQRITWIRVKIYGPALDCKLACLDFNAKALEFPRISSLKEA